MLEAAEARATFDQAITLLKAGQSVQAESLCRSALQRDPSDANFLALLGAVLLQRKQASEAEPLLRRAVRIAPGFARAHEDLGAALVGLSRIEEGIQSLRRALEIDPALESAWLKLGHALASSGRPKEADESFEKAFALSPDRGALAHALEHFRNRRFKQAEKLAREVVQRNPNDVNALRLMAKLAMEAGRWDDAERLLRRVVKLAPDFIDAWHELGAALKEQEKPVEALECIEQSLEIDPDNPHSHFLHAGTLAFAARTYEAVDAYRRSLELRPGHPGALLGLGHVLKTVGRHEEGVQAYRDAIRAHPNFGEAYWSLANLKTFRFSDQEIAEIANRLRSGKLDADSEVHFCFALAKAHEDRADFDTAFTYYGRANQKQRMRVAYDPVQTEVMHQRIREVFTKELMEEKAGQGHPDRAPIFIVGLPRSGSTLIEQILASHSRVEGTSELPELGKLATSLNRRGGGLSYPDVIRTLGRDDFNDLGRRYMERTHRHRQRGAPRFTDKMPNNFPTVGFLHLILPNATIINARRHPLDTCLGCYKQHFAKGQAFTYDLVELGEFYLEYHRMMEHWHEVLPGRVLDVRYEDMVADQEGMTRRLIEFCGLPWEDQCLRFWETERAVRTASSEQVRRPIYGDSVGNWRNFQRHLQPLIEILQPIL